MGSVGRRLERSLTAISLISVKTGQVFAPGLVHDPQLVIGYRLEQRLGEQAKALNLLLGLAGSLGLVILPHGIDSLMNWRLASLD